MYVGPSASWWRETEPGREQRPEQRSGNSDGRQECGTKSKKASDPNPELVALTIVLTPKTKNIK
jgi:hypothetical protein